MTKASQEMGCFERSLGVLASLITIYTFVVSFEPLGHNITPLRARTFMAVMSSLSRPTRSLLAIVIQAALGRFYLTSWLIVHNSRSGPTALLGMIATNSLIGWLTMFNVETLLIHKEGHVFMFLALVLAGLSINLLVVWVAEEEVLTSWAFFTQFLMFIVIAVSAWW